MGSLVGYTKQGRIEPRGHATSYSAYTDGIVLNVRNRNPSICNAYMYSSCDQPVRIKILNLVMLRTMLYICVTCPLATFGAWPYVQL